MPALLTLSIFSISLATEWETKVYSIYSHHLFPSLLFSLSLSFSHYRFHRSQHISCHSQQPARAPLIWYSIYLSLCPPLNFSFPDCNANIQLIAGGLVRGTINLKTLDLSHNKFSKSHASSAAPNLTLFFSMSQRLQNVNLR